MTVLSLVMALSIGVIQSTSEPMDSGAGSTNPPFTEDFQRIHSLGQAKDSAGLETMAADLKARWKDQDMDGYCRLVHEVLKGWRNEFDPVDYGKIKALSEDVLTDLETRLKQGIDPVLVPQYFEFQAWYISSTYGPKPSTHALKGNADDKTWVNKRKDVMTRLLKVWKLLQDAKDPAWDINLKMPRSVTPRNGGRAGVSPESIKDPDLRAEYEADIRKNADRHTWFRQQYRLRQTEDTLKQRLPNDIKVMYNTPPLAPDELKGLLDTYVKDGEQKKVFLEASQK